MTRWYGSDYTRIVANRKTKFRHINDHIGDIPQKELFLSNQKLTVESFYQNLNTMIGGDANVSTKRNYIRRKKLLQQSTAIIESSLDLIARLTKPVGPIPNLRNIAFQHAKQIEAAVWNPHQHVSADTYELLMKAKTNELCIALLKNAGANCGPNIINNMQTQTGNNNQAINLPLPIPNISNHIMPIQAVPLT